jgi:hypothetical protein
LQNRAVTAEVADNFGYLMKEYARRAEAVGAGFDMNPSPGNIKDGLITDAIKSAGLPKSRFFASSRCFGIWSIFEKGRLEFGLYPVTTYWQPQEWLVLVLQFSCLLQVWVRQQVTQFVLW